MREGLMMDDYPLSLTSVVERVERLSGEREVVFRRPDGSVGRTTYGECAHRARRLATALQKLGVENGDVVGTLLWNQPEHLELYFALPSMGAVLHTINPRLHPDELSFIVDDAEDRVIVVDESLLEVFESFREGRNFEHVIVVTALGLRARGHPGLRAAHRRGRADGLAGTGRALGGGHVLHVGHDGAAQGRRLLAPVAGPAFAGRRASRRQLALPRGHPAARGADVPRQRVGTHLHRGADRVGPRAARSEA